MKQETMSHFNNVLDINKKPSILSHGGINAENSILNVLNGIVNLA